jgi:hypothetical protein
LWSAEDVDEASDCSGWEEDLMGQKISITVSCK